MLNIFIPATTALLIIPGLSAFGSTAYYADTTASTDTSIELIFPLKDNSNSLLGDQYHNSFDPGTPSNIEKSVEYDPESKQYIINQTLGDRFYRNPSYLSFEEYLEYEADKSKKDYWKQRTNAEEIVERSGLIPQLQVKSEVFDRIFGGSTVDIRPRGSATLEFGGNWQRTENPAFSDKQKKSGSFDFDMQIQMSLIGQIGEKLKITTNYNTESDFEFENQMRLEYTGYEDEIIKKIEAGNVSLPLSGTLITGSPSLFGIKTQLQFGRLMVTNVLSQQKSETSTIHIENGAQTSSFEVHADNYEANKHFFLAHSFRENYNKSLEKLPIINSAIDITKIEVWVTNERSETENVRDIIAFMDLGENNPYSGYTDAVQDNVVPDNGSNNLISKIVATNPNVRYTYQAHNILSTLDPDFREAQDFVVVETARRLNDKEFYLQSKLGYISLNFPLNSDEVLAVAYQYTYNGVTYQVGEFSLDIPLDPQQPNVLYMKMLKSTTTRNTLPIWNLIMKNIYSIGAYSVQNTNFKLDVIYEDDVTGANTSFIPDDNLSGIPLITLLNLDNLNSNKDPYPDGIYDFIDGVTIHASNGRVVFPVLEPFGDDLRKKFKDTVETADKYVFDALYDSTKSIAQQQAEFNKFVLKGVYQSSSGSDFSLGAMNVPQGSVVVTANGTKLIENEDYTIDYLLGRGKIIKEGILQSGAKIDVKFDNNALFAIKQKVLKATHFDYKVSDNFNLGATVLKLSEKPLTPKIDMGDEPVSNTIWGLDGKYHTESGFITSLIDKIPLIDTKTVSDIDIDGEFAQLRPGHHKDIEQDKEPVSYIDDFESSKSPIDLKSSYSWVISSTPQMFSEAALSDNLSYGINRAKLAWYVIDPLFYRNDNLTPDHIKNSADQSNHFSREVLETEIFKNKQSNTGQNIALSIMNLTFNPKYKGPYNYDVAGTLENGTLNNPQNRWGGLMRELMTTDFEGANVDYIEFWLMDPFVYDPTVSGGELYVNLGNISEDILKDSRKSFENGLPKSSDIINVDSTSWGLVPAKQSIVPSFDNDPDSRQFQDVGLDGLSDGNEASFYKNNYLDPIATKLGTSSVAYQDAAADPSSDNFHYFRGNDYDDQQVSILNRYKQYNGLEGNSPTSEQSKDLGVSYPTAASTRPDVEDINKDNTLNKLEEYFQYKIDLRPSKMDKVGENHITDIVEATVTNKFTGQPELVKWYQFKIPINNPDEIIGDIQDFKSIRFMRLFLTNFQDSVIVRFAKLQLVRSEWRKYNFDLSSPTELEPDDNISDAPFEVSTVNIEENGDRSPVNYVLPPGIERERNVYNQTFTQLNEQSLSLKACNLPDGEARAVYKNLSLDIRTYKKIKMYIHAEGDQLNNNDVHAFIRLGTDFTSNYYEYEIPLTVTPPGTISAESIWPVENEINVALEQFQAHKIRRDQALSDGSHSSKQIEYKLNDGNNIITVKGIPDLSSVRTIMIGIRNPQSGGPDDDGLPKCAEIWVNELRLAEFDEKGGWAAKARVQTKLADLGSLTLSGSKTTFGFGGVEQAITQRSKENTTQYDVSSNIQMGKFFPDKLAVRVPMYVGYSELISKPQFDPYNPDILFETKMDALKELDKEKQDSIRKISRNYTARKSINFTNIQVAKTLGKKNRFYDPQNLTFTVVYNQILNTNPTVEGDTMNNYKVAMAYNFNTNPKNLTPFKNIDKPRPKKEQDKEKNPKKPKKTETPREASKNRAKEQKVRDRKVKYLRLIKEFNFFTAPRILAFRTDLDRRYGIKQMRNVSGYEVKIAPTFDKLFTWNRHYTLKHDFTKSLKLDFTANNQARIDEPLGRIDTDEEKDTIMNNLRQMGRTTAYEHTASMSYSVPINKFPLTDWITLNTRYNTTYDWQAAPLGALNLGNTISNTKAYQVDGQFNLPTLYNKIGYLKKINSKSFKPSKKTDKGKSSSSAKDTTATKEKKQSFSPAIMTENFFKVLMCVKNVSFNYSLTNGTILPGYIHNTEYIGQDWNEKAPGLDFLFGYQPTLNWMFDKAGKRWITTDTSLNNMFIQNNVKNISARSSVEPLRDVKIDLNASYTFSKSNKQYFRNISPDYDNPIFDTLSPIESGSFTITYLTWKTAFQGEKAASNTFTKFEDNRYTISRRLGAENNNSSGYDSSGYSQGYSSSSQDVLIPAFLAAYTGQDPLNISLSSFPIPKPNWRITYNGLSKIPWVNKYFNSINLSHAYRSTYSINNYTTLLKYQEDGNGESFVTNPTGNFLPKYEVSQISVSEQFSPLINVDMQWRNSLITKFELKKNRVLSMSFSNSQFSQTNDFDAIVGLGYRFKEFLIPFKIKGEQKRLKNDLNCKIDLSFRNSKTLIRKLDQDIVEPTKGSKTITLQTSIDYVVNERLNVKVFYNRTINKPVISTSFPTINTKAGVSLRFTLS